MNKRILVALPLVLLLGCGTPRHAAERPPPVTVQAVPPPDFQRDLPLEPPGEYDGAGAFCQLGTSCMALDPRPFEPCLVSGTKRCVDKATEPLLIADETRPPD